MGLSGLSLWQQAAASSFYTPFGVTLFGTPFRLLGLRSRVEFLYALRRDLVWDGVWVAHSTRLSEFLYALRRDLVWDVITPKGETINGRRAKFLYALRRDLVWDEASKQVIPARISSFYTPFGVTLFGTRSQQPSPAACPYKFLYALRRDLVWDSTCVGPTLPSSS